VGASGPTLRVGSFSSDKQTNEQQSPDSENALVGHNPKFLV
jgi:hypothetical protein